jgi:SAM-dependent methyltransferase
MDVDIRSDAARFYDYNPNVPDDVPFYRARLPSPDCSVLELGCGTGRVALALADHCRSIVGIDRSDAMINICKKKLSEAGFGPSRANVRKGDISDFNLDRQFDVIIAPFRVLQNIESNDRVDGLLMCIRRHLCPRGTCILNAFNPNADPDTMRRTWCRPEEHLSWEADTKEGRVACFDRRLRLNPEPLILYPQLVYRRFADADVKEEAVLDLVMRCYYPDELLDLVSGHGFKVVKTWGGYGDEEYGAGAELVVQFAKQ